MRTSRRTARKWSTTPSTSSTATSANRDFALRTLEAAKKAGADVLCLCDTNGGMLTSRLAEICADVRKNFDGVLGIHTHNDSELAVANALAAVEQGFAHVQGCINGYGERCGNANLITIIANLELKMGHTTIGKERLTHLTAAARFIAELANLPMRNDQAYVGHSAFAHKGGVHVSAVLKDSSTYEHINPKLVGNRQRVLLSDLSGRGNILYKLKQHGLEERLDDAARRELLDRIKQMEFQGYELEAAEGTFELLVREALRPGLQFFEVVSYETTTKSSGISTATVTLKAQDGVHSGDGQRQRSGERAGSGAAAVSVDALSRHRRRAADRLQGPRAGLQEGHRGPRARADRVVRSPAELGHGRRLGERHRSELVRPGRCSAPGTDAAERERPDHPAGRRRLLLGRLRYF